MVFVADEVQSGFARTGRLFACEHEGVVPDLIVTAKGIAGGLTLAAVTGRTEIMDAPHVGGLGGTYGGNPLACAAALAVLETIEEGRLLDRAREIGTTMTARLTALQDRDARVGEVRGRGAMIAVELVRAGSIEPDPQLAKDVAAAAHAGPAPARGARPPRHRLRRDALSAASPVEAPPGGVEEGRRGGAPHAAPSRRRAMAPPGALTSKETT